MPQVDYPNNIQKENQRKNKVAGKIVSISEVEVLSQTEDDQLICDDLVVSNNFHG